MRTPPPPPRPRDARPARRRSAARRRHPAGCRFLKFIVGTEKLQVSMRIDIARFNPPGSRPRTRGTH